MYKKLKDTWTNKEYFDGKSYSQINQDKTVLDYLNDNGSFYVDIGSSSGKYLSNTYIMDTKLGWKGLCIDPYPKDMDDRTCDICKSVISSENGQIVEFTEGDEYGGITKYLGSHKDKIKNKPKKKYVTKNLKTVFEEYNVPFCIDYMSLDTEGSEYEILKGMPFDKYCVKTITVEHNLEKDKRQKIQSLLQKNGYKFVKNLLIDDFYINDCKNYCK